MDYRRSSWIDSSSGEEDEDALHSPLMLASRPRAPTPSAAVTPLSDDLWQNPIHHDNQPVSISLNSPLSPLSGQNIALASPAFIRSISEGDSSLSTPSFARPPKQPTSSYALPDPSAFPDPYPHSFRHHLTSGPPALSSAGSSSASTRSSAYTSSGSALASGDYGHVHVASGDGELDESSVGVGITSDSVIQMMANEPIASTSAQGMHSRMPVDQSRWSESYSVRSRSSSVGNNTSSSHGHELRQRPSYDMGWQTVDERDEIGVSEEETDDDPVLGDLDDDEEEDEEERTSAVVIAEQGRGMIVQGEGVPIMHVQVQPGTTHLLLGSSTSPNALPSFLTNVVPQICVSLLALDISANYLNALPPVLALCQSLEELNIASNPLRVLPVFLADLLNLRVLIADATGISTLPDMLIDLDKLHTISIRRNKMHALPSWLCLLPALQTLYIDGNPFQGPWKALVEPLLAKVPMTPVYPPSTPIFPLLTSASTQSSLVDTETDNDDLSEPPSSGPNGRFQGSPEEEDHTITPERAPWRSGASPLPPAPSPQPSRGLTRTRTTPNRGYSSRTSSNAASVDPRETPSPQATSSSPYQQQQEDPGYLGDREIRKMKSAGDLRRGKSANVDGEFPSSSPNRPALSHYATSLSSSNLLNIGAGSNTPERPGMTKRFASLGPSSSAQPRARYPLTKSVWDSFSENEDDSLDGSPQSNRTSATADASPQSTEGYNLADGNNPIKSVRVGKEGKEKEKTRWGFLKKMSMGRMKVDSSSPAPRLSPRPSHGAVPRPPPANMTASSSSPDRLSKTPRINMRISTTGTLGVSTAPVIVPALFSPSEDEEDPPPPTPLQIKPQQPTSAGFLSVSTSSPSLLSPPSSLPKSSRRRSFLPIDGPLSLNIPIPSASAFVPGVTATNEADEASDAARGGSTPSPTHESEQYLRREEERARDGYQRALRSVMAYLKDMNDLGSSQQPNPTSMYGAVTDDVLLPRSRRPTGVDSIASNGSTPVSDSPGQLRNSESMAGLRRGGSAQTMSVATTDSSGSGEERKFKDDKGKRAMVVREIVVTERTYVKSLQELVDIYIKPACAPVNILGGSSKDTLVPISERKIVFGGIDALFSFHKDSFLPALEIAAAPLMRSAAELQEADSEGQLSLSVAKALGNIFLKHAAFMRMYSSYINNFDSSVQRVRHWTVDRPATASSPASTTSPSSTAQLIGLGLSMSAVSSPSVAAEGGTAATGVPNLSSGQRKRIRSYLKRCRINPRHSQLNLEGYLLLPVQRIPRYRLLLEELLRSTPPTYEYIDDPLDRALAEISSLANNMNEGKRESESRRKLVQWQGRIRGKFPSPLVQPHRRLIMDGPLLLTRVVRKAMVSFEAINAQGDPSTVQVDCLAPELTPRPLVGILCNDLLVLCRDPSEGKDPGSVVDLWAVLRMQTLPQPASIVHGNSLRLVDNKAILYFDAPSPSDALNWYRAINLHIPKT